MSDDHTSAPWLSERPAFTLEKKPVSIVRAMLNAGVAVPDEIRQAALKAQRDHMRAYRQEHFYSRGLTAEGKPRRFRRTGIKATNRREYNKIYHGLFS